jgi:hypothetical protein
MRLELVLALALLPAGAVEAQTIGDVLRRPPLYALDQAPPYRDDAAGPARDDTALWVFVSAASADWSVTAVCFEFECGPATAGFTTIKSPQKGTAVGLLVDGAFAYAVREWIQPDHPKLAAALFYGGAVVRLLLVTQKISDLRRNTARTAPPGT